MKILITGDISTWNINNFKIDRINPKFIKLIKNSDYSIYNLEGPIKVFGDKKYLHNIRSDHFRDLFYKSLINITKKQQPKVFSDKNILNLLKINNNTIVTLANNHIKDLGKEGFCDTLEYLKNYNIKFLGANINRKLSNKQLEIAKNIVFINVNYIASKKGNFDIFLYNSISNDYGAAYLSFDDLDRKIKELKNNNKKIILILHAGKELPKDENLLGINLIKVKNIGADITIIHHPHVYMKTKYEKYNIYILGDFIFHRPGKLSNNRKSALLEILLKENSALKGKLVKFNVDDVYKYKQ
jgi:poly-gamma-glutamate capsule biosynthesis protein CapA/YwtB (metallophosphatase superfamily)